MLPTEHSHGASGQWQSDWPKTSCRKRQEFVERETSQDRQHMRNGRERSCGSSPGRGPNVLLLAAVTVSGHLNGHWAAEGIGLQRLSRKTAQSTLVRMTCLKDWSERKHILQHRLEQYCPCASPRTCLNLCVSSIVWIPLCLLSLTVDSVHSPEDK